MVNLFLQKKIPFLSISKTIMTILNDRNYKKYAIRKPKNINQIQIIDNWAREFAKRKMLKIIKIILFLFVFTSHLKAEIVNNIVIEGNERVNEETIKIYGDIKVNKNYNDKDLNQILLNLYETNFFEEVKVDLSNGTLTVKISEYPILNQIVLLGENSVRISREIKKLFF